MIIYFKNAQGQAKVDLELQLQLPLEEEKFTCRIQKAAVWVL